ncbi:hypothetical protein OIE52_09815 [Streptomyces canus]|uniref:hypothetical protein n=1 Tax=Streptomyces canus TaxID=58343 RepID=UPI0032549203
MSRILLADLRARLADGHDLAVYLVPVGAVAGLVALARLRPSVVLPLPLPLPLPLSLSFDLRGGVWTGRGGGA